MSLRLRGIDTSLQGTGWRCWLQRMAGTSCAGRANVCHLAVSGAEKQTAIWARLKIKEGQTAIWSMFPLTRATQFWNSGFLSSHLFSPNLSKGHEDGICDNGCAGECHDESRGPRAAALAGFRGPTGFPLECVSCFGLAALAYTCRLFPSISFQLSDRWCYCGCPAVGHTHSFGFGWVLESGSCCRSWSRHQASGRSSSH